MKSCFWPIALLWKDWNIVWQLQWWLGGTAGTLDSLRLTPKTIFIHLTHWGLLSLIPGLPTSGEIFFFSFQSIFLGLLAIRSYQMCTNSYFPSLKLKILHPHYVPDGDLTSSVFWAQASWCGVFVTT